jgi:hypothetical protein
MHGQYTGHSSRERQTEQLGCIGREGCGVTTLCAAVLGRCGVHLASATMVAVQMLEDAATIVSAGAPCPPVDNAVAAARC